MNLTKIVLDKIKELGATKAAGYFEVSVPTIYSWQKKGNPPVSAAQKVMDESDAALKTCGMVMGAVKEEAIPSPESEVDPRVIEEQVPAPLPGLPPSMVDQLFSRLEKIENFMARFSDPDANVPVTSSVQPFRNPESGIQIKSRAEVLDGQPDRTPEAPLWNRSMGSAPKPSGWNQPIVKTEGRPAPSNWNSKLQK